MSEQKQSFIKENAKWIIPTLLIPLVQWGRGFYDEAIYNKVKIEIENEKDSLHTATKFQLLESEFNLSKCEEELEDC